MKGGEHREPQARLLALIGSLVSFMITLPIVLGFNPAAHGMQFVEKSAWIPRFNVYYHLGVDGLSL